MTFLLLLTVCACGSSGSEGEGKDPSGGKEPNAPLTVAEQVCYDENNIKITVTSFDEDGSFMGPELKILVENNGEKNITVQVRDVSINDIMIDGSLSTDVAPGKKANDEISFMSSDLEIANIKTIKKIELYFHIFDSDSWDTISDSGMVTIETSADKSIMQEYDDSGFVAYDQKGYKIVIKKLNDEDSFWGAELAVYVENNSGKDVTVQARDVSINGFMVDPSFSCDVLNGKKAFDTITFFESDLESNNITDITDLEISFHIFDAHSWDTIIDTDAITVKFE